MNEADYSEKQLTLFEVCEKPQTESTQSGLCGKMSQEHLAQIKGMTLELCWKKSQKPTFQCLILDDGARGGWLEAQNAMWHGEHLTLNTGVSPSVERESFLLQVLEPTADQKYYLSQRACLGILRRAETRGKVLPEILHKALTRQAGLSSQELQAVMAGN